MDDLRQEIARLKREKNAVILAHNYQLPEVQDAADFVADSLGLARKAAETDADLIVFCGVHFMAETASIISPEKKVLIPDLAAGCSLSDSITAKQLTEWKAEHPDAVVVSYVNTTAEVKALSDYCCTSSNAVKIVQAIPPDKEILFLPDMFLGAHVQNATGRKNMHVWSGECHVHAGIHAADIKNKLQAHKDAEFLVHPECGCTSQAIYNIGAGDIKGKILSTEGMVNHARESSNTKFVIATETGILHKMRSQNPEKEFFPIREDAVCKYMKMITLPKVLNSLQNEVFEVKVPPATADKARLAIERMLAIG